MLQQVRGTLKGAVAWLFVILLILGFALFGVPELNQFTSSGAVSVGKAKFSSQYVQNEFNRAIQIRRQETGGNFTREDAIATGLADQVVNSIATTAALDQFSGDLGLAMPRAIVRDFLQENESFQNPATGQFDRFILEGLLQRNNMSVEEFERRIAEDLMRNQLIGSLSRGGSAPSPMVEASLLRQSERRRVAYLTVTNEMSGTPAEPGPDDLENYYQSNIANFTAPEYRTFDMVLLTQETFSEGLSVPEEELRKTYDLNRERLYEEPEKRTLYQVTFDTEPEAQAAVASLRQGQNFELVASARGLDMDAVTFADAQARDILDPSVSEAAFVEGLTEGSTLDPVKSLFGWTVVQIGPVTAPVIRTYEEVRGEIEAQFLDNDTRRAMLAAIDVIEEERDTGATLADAAETADLTVQRIGPIDRVSFTPGGAIIDAVPGEALAEAFQLEEGEESEAVAITNASNTAQNYVFVSLRETTPPTPLPFEEVRDQVEQGWRAQERNERISNTARLIREAVEGGQSLTEAAAPFDRAPIETVIDRRFENDVVSRALNEQVFFADLGQLVSGPTALGAAQAVIEVRNITFARNEIQPNEAAMYEQYLGYQLDQELLDAFVNAVRDDYGVEVNRAQLETLYTNNL